MILSVSPDFNKAWEDVQRHIGQNFQEHRRHHHN